MNRKRWRLLTILLCALSYVALPGFHSAEGHVVTNEPSPQWYFRGATYPKSNADQRIDPINFIFLGGPQDSSDYTRARIEDHMESDWNVELVGGRGWRRDSAITFYCKSEQRMRWVGYPGETSDQTDWHGTTSRNRARCGSQHHARFWDDHEHARQAASHGRQDQWVVGGIHHERNKTLGIFGHEPDRDWDTVRYEMVRAMSKHCSERTWKYHPGADGQFQNYDNSGFIARISLRHRDSPGGCEGY